MLISIPVNKSFKNVSISYKFFLMLFAIYSDELVDFNPVICLIASYIFDINTVSIRIVFPLCIAILTMKLSSL